MNKIRPVLLLLVSALPLCGATTVVEEIGSGPLEKSKWKVSGDITAEQGLKLHAVGDEAGFANAMMTTASPLPELNFSEKDVEFRLKDLNLTGEAPPAKQAFVLLLATDKPSEASASSYLRLIFNGDGKMNLAAATGAASDPSKIKNLVSKTVSFPIKNLQLLLTKKGYRLTYEDAGGPQSAEGDWGDKLDLGAWGGTSPTLLMKAVRRPSTGTAEATLGSFTVVNP